MMTRQEKVQYGLDNMRHHANSRLVPPGSDGFTLGKHVFTRPGVSQGLINHEAVHVAQYAQDGIPKFLAVYLYDYLKNLVRYRDPNKAYRNIRYEKEAYDIT
jgi:hypothetical protein